MSQIRAKQIKLQNEGDLIIGNSNGNGSILSIGSQDQVLHVTASSASWRYTSKLYDSTGNLVVEAGNSPAAVNYLTVTGSISGLNPTIQATGFDTNIDINLVPKGNGEILVPSGYTANIVSPNALVNKEYVDTVVTGLDWKNSVKVATTSPSDTSGYTYNAGNEPSGFVWTGVSSAPTIDGITISDGDRILIKNASPATGNGIFVYDATNQAFVRANDANTSTEVSDGLAVFVEQGTINGSTAWVLVSPDGNANLGTDNLVFSQFAGTNLYIAGSGLSLTGNVFSVNESTTIGVKNDNVIVQSNTLQGNVLQSTGVFGDEAVWGALNLSNSNSVTGSLQVTNGGTGLSSIPSGAIVYGNGTNPLNILNIGPASNTNTAYVLKTNSTGTAPEWSAITLNQLVDVSAPTPSANDFLTFNGTEWVPVSSGTFDKFVKVSPTDTTAGYLSNKLQAGLGISISANNSGGNENLIVDVVTDNSTTLITGGNAVAVGGGSTNQVLISQGSSQSALWSYLGTLYNQNGYPLLAVTGSGQTLNVYVSPTEITVSSPTNLNLTATSSVFIQGTEWPTNIPERSVLVANTDNTLEALQAANNANQLLLWNVATSSFAFVSADKVGGNSFGTIQMIGSWWNGSQFVSATSNSDTLKLEGTRGIFLSAVNTNKSIQIGITSSAMPLATPSQEDLVMFFDATSSYIPSTTSISAFFTTFGVPTNVVTTSGLLVQISSGNWVTREIVANTSADRLGIEIINGDGINGNPTVGLNIEGLVELSANAISGNDFFVVYSNSNDVNRKVTLSSVFAVNTPSNYKWFNITDGTNTATPDAAQDTLTVFGSGVAVTINPVTDTIEFNLGFDALPPSSPINDPGQLSDFEIAVYDTGNTEHRLVNAQDLILTQVEEIYASANATGAVNESFVNFFTNNFVIDNNVQVFFNGLALKKGGWTRTGTTLTLVDSVNGYSTEPGDVITARYIISQL